MSTYVLVHGASSDSTYWYRVTPLLQALGHEVITPDLPVADPTAGLAEYTDAIVDAVGDRPGVILVAHSMAAYSAPPACERIAVDLLVLVAAMTPKPGEAAGDWWEATGQVEAQRAQDLRDGRDPDAPFDPLVTFLHDVPPEDLDEVLAQPVPVQSDRPFADPWPAEAWPPVPTRFLLCRDDRLFPADFQRRIVPERLGITPDEMDGDHLPAFSRPAELVEWLEHYRTTVVGAAR
ncbi:alpha/beta hydrolase [Actinokineospora sp. PR83]|uniref:alpha/beta hydrolase n=1 Tax=Actinokineospora sp. PR83 TaxID=2884908 RepID=UPI0027E0FEBD|nr:alpha/beta hydrolase [Actinokineospora sp. PR83]MCG8916264.1 alpha/beta hydrolase [Actinokineospora sp. PR83]